MSTESTNSTQNTNSAQGADVIRSAAPLMAPLVTSGPQTDAARPVRFDRPLVDLPAWADPRLARQLAEVTRTAREQGLAEGYAAGWAQGRRAADETARTEAAARAGREEAARRRLAARAKSLLTALAETAQGFTEHVVPAWDEIVDVLLDGALRIAAAGLGRELESVDAVVLEAARTALRVMPTTDVIRLHVNPADIPLLGDTTGLPDGLTLVPDADVAAGSVVARSTLQSLPVDLRTALRAVEEVLRG